MGTNNKQGSKIALVLALLLAVNVLVPALVSAGGLTNTYLRLNRMATGTDSTIRLVFTTSAAVVTEDNVKIDLGAAWAAASGSVFNGSITATSASCAAETGATAMPGTLVGTGVSAGSTITITGVTNLTASTAYCVDLTTANTVHNPTAGTYFATITTQTSSTVDDSAKVALAVVGNDSITVTATVPPTFSFALDSNTTAFTANLSPGTKQVTTPRTVTVNTNAKTGWVAWLRDASAANAGLYSASVNAKINPTTPGTAANVDASPNVEQYVWGVTAQTQTAGVGTTSLNTAYDATGGTNDGSGIDNSYRQIASSNGTSQDAVLTLAAAATISPITPAASDYSDVIQVIGAGNF